eukprot:maker-scaffold_3-snap-gene-9.43-mRNA-1 protein AED:0.35 eAED:0.35 QI:205/1/0.5/1/1/1/2/0/976
METKEIDQNFKKPPPKVNAWGKGKLSFKSAAAKKPSTEKKIPKSPVNGPVKLQSLSSGKSIRKYSLNETETVESEAGTNSANKTESAVKSEETSHPRSSSRYQNYVASARPHGKSKSAFNPKRKSYNHVQKIRLDREEIVALSQNKSIFATEYLGSDLVVKDQSFLDEILEDVRVPVLAESIDLKKIHEDWYEETKKKRSERVEKYNNRSQNPKPQENKSPTNKPETQKPKMKTFDLSQMSKLANDFEKTHRKSSLDSKPELLSPRSSAAGGGFGSNDDVFGALEDTEAPPEETVVLEDEGIDPKLTGMVVEEEIYESSAELEANKQSVEPKSEYLAPQEALKFDPYRMQEAAKPIFPPTESQRVPYPVKSRLGANEQYDFFQVPRSQEPLPSQPLRDYPRTGYPEQPGRFEYNVHSKQEEFRMYNSQFNKLLADYEKLGTFIKNLHMEIQGCARQNEELVNGYHRESRSSYQRQIASALDRNTAHYRSLKANYEKHIETLNGMKRRLQQLKDHLGQLKFEIQEEEYRKKRIQQERERRAFFPHSQVPAPKYRYIPGVWYYQDPKGEPQGPFDSKQMLAWYRSGSFTDSLPVARYASTNMYVPLGVYFKNDPEHPFVELVPNNEPVEQLRYSPNLPHSAHYGEEVPKYNQDPPSVQGLRWTQPAPDRKPDSHRNSVYSRYSHSSAGSPVLRQRETQVSPDSLSYEPQIQTIAEAKLEAEVPKLVSATVQTEDKATQADVQPQADMLKSLGGLTNNLKQMLNINTAAQTETRTTKEHVKPVKAPKKKKPQSPKEKQHGNNAWSQQGDSSGTQGNPWKNVKAASNNKSKLSLAEIQEEEKRKAAVQSSRRAQGNGGTLWADMVSNRTQPVPAQKTPGYLVPSQVKLGKEKFNTPFWQWAKTQLNKLGHQVTQEKLNFLNSCMKVPAIDLVDFFQENLGTSMNVRDVEEFARSFGERRLNKDAGDVDETGFTKVRSKKK